MAKDTRLWTWLHRFESDRGYFLITMKNKKVDQYIDKTSEFAYPICTKLRVLIFKADPTIIEEFKWGSPIYTKKKMICGFGAFKEHVTFTFFQGVLLADKKRILLPSSNHHNRSIKFKTVEEMNEKILLEYIKEAIENDENELKAVQPILAVPSDFKEILLKENLVEKFQSMNYTYRKEFIDLVTGAKKEETRKRRIEKAVELIKENKGL